jgi:hypothetical protein
VEVRRRARREKKGKGREKKREEEYDKGPRSKSLGICRMTRSRIRG